MGAILTVGLDPEPSRLPACLVGSDADRTVAFCEAIIRATASVAGAYKPNLAFFEALGADGWSALRATVDAVRRFAPRASVILDGKRGDIGSTAERYAAALYDGLGADAVTLSPYMGRDAVAPFCRPGKTVFLLALTSNPGSTDLQRLSLDSGEPLWQRVLSDAPSWADSSGATVGFVVGATHPDDLPTARRLAGAAPLLVPGFGAQGGDWATAVRDLVGGPAYLNVGRAILYASSGDDFAERAGRVAAEYAARLG